jgi:uncharacterized LabA/DUF88 family protein
MKRAIILIDGQNLYYGLKDLRVNERDVLWDLFFKSLLSPEDELVRTYWFRPQKILDTNHSPYQIRHTVCYKSFRNHSNAYNADTASIPRDVHAKIEEQASDIEKWLRETKEKFSQSEYKYDQISLEFGDIEVVKTGVLKVDPFKKLIIGEKGVDISLAVKMMTLSVQQRCDKIILVSGDYDYAEAIKFVKDNMTKIHLVKFHKGTPPQNRSVSRDLAILADKVLDVYESDLQSKFVKNNP